MRSNTTTKTSCPTTPLLLSLLLLSQLSLSVSVEEVDDDGSGDIDDNDITNSTICDNDHDDCDQNCKMVNGEPICSCYGGYRLDEDGKTCHDINECELENDCKFKCVNLIGSYECQDDDSAPKTDDCKVLLGCSHDCVDEECTCPDGFDLDDDEKTCIDIDECLEGNKIYDDDASEDDEDDDDDLYDEDYPKNKLRKKRFSTLCSYKCINTLGSFYCTCPLNSYLSRDMTSCIEDDDVLTLNCSHYAIKIYDKFKCSCPNNLVLDNDGKTCTTSISKCDKNCTHQCSKQADKYICICPEGFYLFDDGLSCVKDCDKGYAFDKNSNSCLDINECEDENVCEHGCKNLEGSFECLCPEGYVLDVIEKNCNPVDKCDLLNCSHVCDPENLTCNCPKGYILDEDKKNCKPIDKCVLSGCSHGCNPDNLTCNCPNGHILNPENSKECIIDPCTTDANKCSNKCNIINGKITCLCPSDMQLDFDNVTCVYLSGCQKNNGGCSHKCKENLNGSVSCICPPHLVLINDTKCISSDQACKNRCSHLCSVLNGTVSCECPSGYKLAVDGFNCDLDPCYDDKGGCSHFCNSIGDEIICSCPSNHRLSASNRFLCVEIDSCSMNNGKCSQICKDVNGSAVCDCFEGYILENKVDCTKIDMNPCEINNGNCSDICITIDGVVKCECSAGKVMLSEGTCVDTCSVNNGGCYQKCNSKTDKLCSCYEGFELNADGVSCDDVDECETNQNDCQQACLNSDGDYECGCHLGYKLTDDQKTCEDINECESDNSLCTYNCVNTLGSYNCTCPDNMILVDDNECEFLNTCYDNNGGCSQICETGNDGDVICTCRKGYVLNEDGQRCDDINECILNISNCSDSCINIDGGYNCICEHGKILSSDGHTCVKYNRCELENGGCSHSCIDNTTGIFCGCPVGYFLNPDERNCDDINECLLNVCEFDCINTLGSFQCICKPGYKLTIDNKTCEDIDECTEKCDQNCLNTPGSFKCECFEGYELNSDGLTCNDLNECLNNVCSHECINTLGSYKCICPVGYVLEDDKNCIEITCNEGYDLDKNNTCVDIDECLTYINGGCSQICQNLPGGFMCGCYDGFSLDVDKVTCIPKDPCLIDNGGCSQSCTVSADKMAICGCDDGFETDPKNKSSCVDVNECAKKNRCDHKCINSHGSYKCVCNEGYVDNNNVCDDINECDAIESPCDKEMICINTPGYYRCECKPGYVLKINGTRSICVEDNKSCKSLMAPLHGNMKCFNDKNVDFMFKSGTRCHFWCEKGHRLKGSVVRKCDTNGQWDGIETKCVFNPCPRLVKPVNGNFVPSKCVNGDSYPYEFCTLVCQPGYKPRNARILTCSDNNQWMPFNSMTVCVPNKALFKTFIKCPSDVKVQLKPSERDVNVVIPRPTSNMDWWRYIDSDPVWAKVGQKRLKPGTYPVIYKARSAYNETAESCQFTITVIDAEKPTVIYCPSSIDIKLHQGEYFRRVFWNEPKFSDNIGVNEIHRSKVPGSYVGIGIHHVDYIATDHSGNKAYCHFTLNVIDPDRDVDEFHLRQGVLMCPGQYPRRTYPGELAQIPKGCTLRWLKQKMKPENYRSGPQLRHYDGWNSHRNHMLRHRTRTHENYIDINK